MNELRVHRKKLVSGILWIVVALVSYVGYLLDTDTGLWLMSLFTFFFRHLYNNILF